MDMEIVPVLDDPLSLPPPPPPQPKVIANDIAEIMKTRHFEIFIPNSLSIFFVFRNNQIFHAMLMPGYSVRTSLKQNSFGADNSC
jgi:hypothetical protein